MFIAHDKLQEVSGVAATGQFTVKVPVGYSYHDFLFVLGGTAFNLSHLSNLVLWINGREVQTIRTSAELDSVNKFDRLTAFANGLLRWPMERMGLDERIARERTILGTGISESVRATLQDPKNLNYDPVEVRSVHITGQITGATAPTLEVYARRSAPRPTGVVKKVRNFVRNPAGAGEFEISDLPLGEVISRVIFKDSAGAGDISRVRLMINGTVVFDRTPVQNDRIQVDGVRTPQTGYFVYDPAEDGAGGNSPPVGSKDDVRWIITTTGAVTLDIQYETLGYLAG